MRLNKRQKQFDNNLDHIIGGYENSQMDYGIEGYPDMTAEEWINYVMVQVYDIKADGHGSVWYGVDICRDLRFLGNKYMHERIIEEAASSGMLKE